MKKITLIGKTGIHSSAEISVSQEILIGRDAKVCQLVYPSTERIISSVHCKIQVVNDEVYLTDMNSTNGTFLENGTKLNPLSPVRILNGQGFYLGNWSNSFVIKEEIIANSSMAASCHVERKSETTQGKSDTIGSKKMRWGIPTVAAIAGVVFVVMIGIVMISVNQANEASARAYQAEWEKQQAEQALEDKENQGLVRTIFDGINDFFDQNWW